MSQRPLHDLQHPAHAGMPAAYDEPRFDLAHAIPSEGPELGGYCFARSITSSRLTPEPGMAKSGASHASTSLRSVAVTHPEPSARRRNIKDNDMHRCHRCPTMFTTRRAAKRHLRSTHKLGQTLGCPSDGCEYTCVRADCMKKHWRRKHEGEQS